MDKLISKNILLRKAELKDLEPMLNNIWSDEEIFKFMAWKPIYTMAEAQMRLENIIEFQKANYFYFVAEKETDEAIGFAGIKEIEPGVYGDAGICIAQKCQGLGFGKEILSLLLDLAFNKLGANEFIYGCMSHNERSKNLCLKFGFDYKDSTIRTRSWDDYSFQDDHYSLKREKYLSQNS